MIEPLDELVQRIAWLRLGDIRLDLRDVPDEDGLIEIGDRMRDIGQNGETLLGHLSRAAEHDDARLLAARRHHHDARTQRRHERRVFFSTGKVALAARDVDLLDIRVEISSLSGETSSNGNVAISPPPYALERGLRGFGGEPLGLLDGFLDGADHVERRFGQVVVLAVDRGP